MDVRDPLAGVSADLFGALVTAQFALAVVLLVAGGLLVRSFSRLMNVDPGFRAERVLTLSTSLPASAYPQRLPTCARFYNRLLENITAGSPGVTAAEAASTDLPLGIRERRAFTIEAETDTLEGGSRTSSPTIGSPDAISRRWVFR